MVSFFPRSEIGGVILGVQREVYTVMGSLSS